MAQQVTTSSDDAAGGFVLATDIDMRFLDQLSAPGLRVMRHDLLRDPLPEGPFDLVHARYVLEHLPEREAILDGLARSLAPGGWLLVESLGAAPVENTEERDFSAAMLTIRAVLERTIGTNFDWSKSLPDALRRRGFQSINGAVYAPLTGLANASALCWSLTLEQLTPRILGLGLATEEELARTHELLEDPHFNGVGHGTLSVWGQRGA
jgi:SAM-dependent methyltransferase